MAGVPSAILVVDARGVPPENAAIVAAANATGTCAVVRDRAPAMSSTIERFVAPRGVCGTSSSIESRLAAFNPAWLSDSGATLGAGRQGCVRLMFLGTLPVAVKLITRGGKFDTFDIEAPLWRTLAGSGAVPDLIGIGTTPCGRRGYIVTRVGVPLSKLLGMDYATVRRWAPADADATAVLESVAILLGGPHTVAAARDAVPAAAAVASAASRRQRKTRSALASERLENDDGAAKSSAAASSVGGLGLVARSARARLQAIEPLVRQAWASRFGGADAFASLEFRCEAVAAARRSLGAIRSAGVLHRDVKVDNMIVFADGTVRLCDFGVAHAVGEQRRVARGNLRQYPPLAVKNTRSYDGDCDEYMLAMCAYEILCGTPVYGHYGPDVQAAVNAKLAGELPVWPPRLLSDAAPACVKATVGWANAVWQRHHIGSSAA